MEEDIIEKIKEKIIEPFYDFPNPISIELKDTEVELIENILNKLEELEKENKELKEELEPIKKLNIPVKILVAEFERLEDIEDRKVQIEYNLVFKKGINHMKSKIEDKIKEYKELQKQRVKEEDFEEATIVGAYIYALKELLEE